MSLTMQKYELVACGEHSDKQANINVASTDKVLAVTWVTCYQFRLAD